jgi:Cof subfamily protein (haloacid dehalogenase superfamily)
MMTLPILCFDLDGTLLDRQGSIHPRDVELLADPDPQCLFVPATGRSFDSVRHTFNKNGLFVGEKIPFPLILQNGSILYNGGERLAAYLPFDPQVQVALIDLAEHYPQVTFLFMGLDKIYVAHSGSFGKAEIERFELETLHFEQNSRRLPFSKVMGISQARQDLDAIAREIHELPVEAAFSMPTALEITPLGVDKGSGMERLLSELGLEHAPVFVAGDGENDLPLMRFARKSFAPTHALEVVKQSASVILEISKDGLLEPMLRQALQHSLADRRD